MTTWMQTASGGKATPARLDSSQVLVQDIAHSLGNLCRWTGHCRYFYCPTMDQRVLTADLRWIPAGDLKEGQELLGFDEFPTELGSTGHKRRRYRHARVLTATQVKRRIIRLEFSDGSCARSSAEHPWLCRSKISGNQGWLTAQSIMSALGEGRSRYVNRFIMPWREESSRDAGWLAGIYDGEGHISYVGRTGVQAGIGQNPGLVLDEIRRLHGVFGFRHGEVATGTYRVIGLQLGGGWRELARLLGSIRPVRLLNKFVEGLRGGRFAKQMESANEPLRVVAAFDEGEEWVAGIETSTRTYLCEGFAAHNSVAQHCVLVSEALTEREHRPDLALHGLIHDAAESFTNDINSPLKCAPEMLGFRYVERRAEEAILAALGMVSLPPEDQAIIKRVDLRMMATEAQTFGLMMPLHPDWKFEEPPYVDHAIPWFWYPFEARQRWLDRFNLLMVGR